MTKPAYTLTRYIEQDGARAVWPYKTPRKDVATTGGAVFVGYEGSLDRPLQGMSLEESLLVINTLAEGARRLYRPGKQDVHAQAANLSGRLPYITAMLKLVDLNYESVCLLIGEE